MMVVDKNNLMVDPVDVDPNIHDDDKDDAKW